MIGWFFFSVTKSSFPTRALSQKKKKKKKKKIMLWIYYTSRNDFRALSKCALIGARIAK